MAKKTRILKKTLLLVGEGYSDCIFLKYFFRCFKEKTNLKITVSAASGKCPYQIINTAVKHKHNQAFDYKAVLLDIDVGITKESQKLAKANNIEIIQSQPQCLEGMLLNAYGITTKEGIKSTELKRIFKEKFSDEVKDEVLEKYFSKERFSQSPNITLQQLLALITQE